jgi:hypothetical protein
MVLDPEREAGRKRVLEARDTSTTPDRLQQLSLDPVRPVRLFTARNSSTPQEALRLLAVDGDSIVRWNALLRADLPGDALEIVAAQESDNMVLLRVIYHHPNAPGRLRTALADRRVCACRTGGWCVPPHWLTNGRWGRPLAER